MREMKSYRLPAELVAKVTEIAKENEETVTHVIVQGLRQYIKNNTTKEEAK